MDNLRTSKHISRRFNEELNSIRNHLLAMGGLVDEQLRKAGQAFYELDFKLAEEVFEEGKKVNQFEHSVDEESAQCLAKRQPAATDLRLILTVLKMVNDIERIGDQAERIARFAMQLERQHRPKDNYHEVLLMTEQVRLMFNHALDAFARMDIKTALDVIADDDKVNETYDSIMQSHIERMKQNSSSISNSLQVLWAIRALERIGDHTCNLCEFVIYLAKGKDVRHLPFAEKSQNALEEPN